METKRGQKKRGGEGRGGESCVSREGKGRTQDLGTYDSRTVDRTFHMNRNSEDLSVGGLAGLLGVGLRFICW